jgi:hypothetical protein
MHQLIGTGDQPAPVTFLCIADRDCELFQSVAISVHYSEQEITSHHCLPVCCLQQETTATLPRMDTFRLKVGGFNEQSKVKQGRANKAGKNVDHLIVQSKESNQKFVPAEGCIPILTRTSEERMLPAE